MTRDPMLPEALRISRVVRETADTFTLTLNAAERGGFFFLPGQFNMLYLHGAGEVPVSISGDPARPMYLVHTIRAVGSVTRPMQALEKGDEIGVRGPFGTSWPVERARGRDVLVVAGGIGLAPQRGQVQPVGVIGKAGLQPVAIIGIAVLCGAILELGAFRKTQHDLLP